MARTEIRYFSGYREEDLNLVQGEQIIESEVIEGPNAISDGYLRFKQIFESERDGWFIQISMNRDFKDNLSIDLTLRIGPEPCWSEEYLREHKSEPSSQD